MTAKLGRKRLILREYKRFEGLKCEIELTSVLYHVSSKIEHDIFYKPDLKIKKQQRETYMNLKTDLEKAMTNYIEKASDLFESVTKRVHEISASRKRYHK